MADLVAGPFLSSFFQAIFDRLASRDFTDYLRRGKLDKLVEELESTLESINQVLDDAEIKQHQNTNVKKWLDDVKHAMYEADQLLDEIATDAPLKKMRAESQPSSSSIFNFIPTFTNPFKSRLKELIESLDSLAEQKDKLQLIKRVCGYNGDGVNSKLSERLPTTYLVDASQIYGRDDEKDEMIKFLLSNNDSDNKTPTPVSSIVGLGGMGKTTFAKLVYNDSRIEDHFEVKAWVYVSESFDVVGLTKAILKSFHSPADDESIFNLLQERLQHILMGKKYLLVLDDIWNGNADCWEQLLLPFNHGSHGSKIIVTTRDKEVANVLKSTKLFDLQKLDKSDCWSLFVTHAFHGKNVCENPNLESIGKKIVEKCGGLPLAVKTMGQLLRKKFSQHEWMKILETDLWRLSNEDNNINPVLRLSYHNLPSNQKRCFSYCSIFPKGYVFGKGELIKIWMAEGLLKCCRTVKSEEELGNEILGDLESISFFQQSPINNHFGMHDLVNDLAKSVSGEFCMQIDKAKVEGIPERTRHIRWSLRSNFVDKLLEPNCEFKGLRSLILKGGSMFISNNVQRDIFTRLKYLRMLSLYDCGISKVVDEISNLKLLRYLDLSFTSISSLPNSICMLWNLQTLLLESCYNLTDLPSNFSDLINLRHIYLPYTLKKMSKHIGNFSNLQTLPSFNVDEQNGSDLKVLEKLNQLHGTILINGLGNVNDPIDASSRVMKDKKYLEEIEMTFDGGREDADGSIVESNVSVIEALQPNSNLRRLIIRFYMGNSFPNWLRDCYLPNLVYLKLEYCGLCSHLPTLGQLPTLKELSISHCHGIKIFEKEFYSNNFNSLEVLRFESMNNWEEWLCIEGFPLLKELSIKYCPKLKRALPQHLPSLQKLVIWDCKMLDVSFPNCDNIHLKHLTIFNSPKLMASRKEWGLFRLNSLKDFSVSDDFANVECFPEEGLLPPTLEYLHLKNCSKLRIMNYKGLLHLKSLKELAIYNCPSLESLPEEGLPNSLSSLWITVCPLLKEKYKKEGGERWHTISHIRNVKIDCIQQH